MKIKKLIVKNYKVFDHLELDFTDKNGDVLDTIVFAGLNGSGKTTILELLRDLFDGKTPQYLRKNTEIILEILLPNIDNSETFRPLFKTVAETLFIEPYTDELDILTFRYKEMNDISNPFLYLAERIDKIVEHFEITEDYTTHIAPQVIYFYSNDLSNFNERTPSDNVFDISFLAHNSKIRDSILKDIQKQVFDNPDVTPRQIFTKQVNELNKIFNNLDIQSKLIQINDKDLIFESINGQKFGFNELSSGEKMLYFTGFSLNSLNPKGLLIMVDEPEDSLHPTWQQQIVRFFQNIGSNNQIILATHSPQIIASVRPESLFVLGIDAQTRRVTAHNMADEHKHTHGVEPNRILSEIMGTPLRDYETQQRINTILGLIKHVEFNPSVSGVVQVEKEINSLAEDLGKQDASIMRFRNEILLLKRKTLVPL